MTEIALIAALARNRAIGLSGRMPWHLPEDLRRFKQLTMGHAIIMGRKTFESIGRPLPGRDNLIVSRQPTDTPGCQVFGSLERALASRAGERVVFVIGGGEIYALAMPLARRMYLTHIDAEFPGDTFFPAFDVRQWRQTARVTHHHEGPPSFEFAFADYERMVPT